MKTEWVPFAAVCVLGLGRALTSSIPAPLPAADDAQRREVFRYVASDEGP